MADFGVRATELSGPSAAGSAPLQAVQPLRHGKLSVVQDRQQRPAAFVRVFVQHFFDGHTGNLRENKLTLNGNILRKKQDAEEQIFTFFRFPRVTGLTFSGCLKIGVNHITFGQRFFVGKYFQRTVG